MECLHGKPAFSSTTKKGTFRFSGQKLSCKFFCLDQDCYMYTKAVAAFRESGCLHPVCPTHQRCQAVYAYSSCVLSEKILVNFRNGVIYLKVQDRCAYTVWCVANKTSRKMVRIRIAYFTAVRKSTLEISSRGSNKSLLWSTLASCCSVTHFNTKEKQERHSIALRRTLEKL